MKRKMIALALILCIACMPVFVRAGATDISDRSVQSREASSEGVIKRLPIKTYARYSSGRITTYNDANLTSTWGYIDCATDEIWITRISGAAAYGSYPTSSGRISRWFKLSDVLLESGRSITGFSARNRINAYRWPGSYSYGYASPGDTVYVLSAPVNGYVQVMYHITGTIYDKIAYISASSVPGATGLPAPADITPGVYTLVSALGNQSKVLDIYGAKTGDNVNAQLYASNNKNHQKFAISKNGAYYRLRAVHSSRFLHVKGAGAGANVVQWRPTYSTNQDWQFIRAGDGFYYIKSRLGGKYLDVEDGRFANEANVLAWHFNGNANQKWKLVKGNIAEAPEPPTSTSGVFIPITGTDAGYTGDSGLDISAPVGTPVYAIADGTLEYSEWGHVAERWCYPPNTAYSLNYKLDSPITYNGKTVRYVYNTHMSKLVYAKAEGSSITIRVRKGQLLGWSGTANSSPHLHLTLYMERSGQYLSMGETRDFFGSYLGKQWLAG